MRGPFNQHAATGFEYNKREFRIRLFGYVIGGAAANHITNTNPQTGAGCLGGKWKKSKS
jgi:hypothetical protein